MRSRSVVGVVGMTCGLAVLTASRPSFSEPPSAGTQRCLDSYVSAQEQRKSEDLLGARISLQTCSDTTCPAIVQNDCTRWFGEVIEAVPSVVLEALVDGESVFDVTVTMDGRPMATQLDGKPIELNPGVHTFRFVRAGEPPVEKRVLVAAHQHGQVVSATWTAPAPSPRLRLAVAGPNAAPEQARRPVPSAVYWLGGVSAVGLATFGVLGIVGSINQHDLEHSCSPTCTSGQVNGLQNLYIAADIGLGVGVVAGGAAVVTWLLSRHTPSPQATGLLDIHPTPGGAAASWTRSF